MREEVKRKRETYSETAQCRAIALTSLVLEVQRPKALADVAIRNKHIAVLVVGALICDLADIGGGSWRVRSSVVLLRDSCLASCAALAKARGLAECLLQGIVSHCSSLMWRGGEEKEYLQLR